MIIFFFLQSEGQGLKDIICWPRPSSPPVIQAPDQWVLEYGMPSTHAMISVVIPFSTLMLTTSRYNYPGYIGLFLACTYCILVSSSRLYLGMHSLAVSNFPKDNDLKITSKRIYTKNWLNSIN